MSVAIAAVLGFVAGCVWMKTLMVSREARDERRELRAEIRERATRRRAPKVDR